ncbi:MAG TPA: hypothetical protein VF602_11840 [Pedobacter sp.]|jgi:hypothetical protein
MTTLKLFTGICIILFLTNCAATLPLNQKFYNSKKVGVIVQIDSIGIAKEGAQGLLDMAMTPGDKYREPLNTIAPKVNPEALLITEISNLLKGKNKQFVVLPENILNQNLVNFDSPQSGEAKYYKKDLRAIKTQHNVEEVLYLKVKYGLLVSYYSMIETDRKGYIAITTNIIDLDDNSLLSHNILKASAPINGKWKEAPEYNNLKNAIQAAINQSVTQLAAKF